MNEAGTSTTTCEMTDLPLQTLKEREAKLPVTWKSGLLLLFSGKKTSSFVLIWRGFACSTLKRMLLLSSEVSPA